MLKCFSPAINAEGVWPQTTVKMFLTFFTLFRQKKDHLFNLYEEQDGEFHGAEEQEKKSRDRIPLTQEDLDEESDESETSFDREFS